MPLIFFILSIALLYYVPEQPKCIYGAAVFAILGILMLSVPESKEKPSPFRKKRRR